MVKEGSEKADASQFELLKVLGQGSFGKVTINTHQLILFLLLFFSKLQSDPTCGVFVSITGVPGAEGDHARRQPALRHEGPPEGHTQRYGGRDMYDF